jgi:hypothetical protein
VEIAVEVVIVLLTMAFVLYPLGTDKMPQSAEPEDDIETQILKLRKQRVTPDVTNEKEILDERKKGVPPSGYVESQISHLRSVRVPQGQISKAQQRKNRQCPKCGSNNPADARFCSECATKLTKDK